MASTSEPAPLVVKCAGSWTGSIEVASDLVTVGALKAQLCSASGLDAVKLIVAGRNLQDDDKTLEECGISGTTRILVLRQASAAQHRALDDVAQRQERVKRLKSAVENMAARSETRSHRSLRLENQDGAALAISAEDQSLLMTGMWLHESAKRHMQQEQWSDALSDLELGDESFQLCQCDILTKSDNAGLLLLDLVWCVFKMQDERRLAGAQQQLQRARDTLTRAHGADLERLRCLHGGFRPELATYVRLEALEGLSQWYSGDSSAAEARFLSAQAKWRQLAVSDESMAALTHMGFSASEGRRALRFCSGDVASAVSFVLQRRRDAQERAAKDARRAAGARQVEALGLTKGGGKAIDMEATQKLSDMGFDLYVAAEALRQADNDAESALNAIMDPVRHAAMTLTAAAALSGTAARKATRKQLRDLGYDRYYVKNAVDSCHPGQLDEARGLLDSWAFSGASVRQPQQQQTGGQQQQQQQAGGEQQQQAGGQAGGKQGQQSPTVATAASADIIGLGEPSSAAAELPAGVGASTAAAGEVPVPPPPPPPPPNTTDHDAAAAEQEVAAVVGTDSLSGYDIDVSEEGDVIYDFLIRIADQRGSTTNAQ